MLLLLAMLVPMLPTMSFALEEPGELGEPPAGPETTIIESVTVEPNGTFTVGSTTSVEVSGEDQTLNIESGTTNIYVSGDYYTETAQYDPVVAELWSGNARYNALWQPTQNELKKSLYANILKEGYAVLYDGFLNVDDKGAYKPEGATRVGEVLGYDAYSRNGEYWNYTTYDDGEPLIPADTGVYTGTDTVSGTWALVNAYRAVGVEFQRYHIVGHAKSSPNLERIVGSGKLTEGVWDINKSPLASYLTGNYTVDQKGFAKPVVELYATRTNPEPYWKQAEHDMLEFYEHDEGMTLIQFLTLVWDLMYTYGESLMTEQEQYMLLEAYGRKLPWTLPEVQLDAVRNLLCRGIIEADDLDNPNWYGPVTFDFATTVLMRVKDEGSRMEFKKFQLTTDLELLQKGYYPQDLSLADPSGSVQVIKQLTDRAQATYYDYLVKRSDNRALFLADEYAENPATAGARNEVRPHISDADQVWYSTLAGSYYMGRTEDGWYRFRVPISAKSPIFVNSSNSGQDDPGQYRIDFSETNPPGGYYVFSPEGTIVSHESFDATSMYVDKPTADADRMRSQQQLAETAENVTYTVVFGKEYQKAELPWLKGTNPYGWAYSASSFDEETGESTLNRATVYVRRDDKGVLQCVLTQEKGVEYTTVTLQALEPPNSTEVCIQVTAPPSITEADVRVICGVDKFPGTNNLDEIAYTSRVSQAYVQRDSNFLVAISYLKSLGWVKEFQRYGDKKFYMSVNIPKYGGSLEFGTDDIDVYIDVTRKRPVCMYGSQATIFPEDTPVVWVSNTDYYVDLRCLVGRIYNPGDGMTDDNGVKYLAPAPEFAMYKTGYLTVRSVEDKGTTFEFTYVELKDPDGVSAKYVWTPGNTWWSNFITVNDLSSNSVRVYSLYELGELSDTDYKNNASAREQFASDFGLIPKSKSVYIKMVTQPLDSTLRKSDTFYDSVAYHSPMVVTANGNILLRMYETPENGAPEALTGEGSVDKLPLLPISRDNSINSWVFTMYNFVRNDSATAERRWEPCSVFANEVATDLDRTTPSNKFTGPVMYNDSVPILSLVAKLSDGKTRAVTADDLRAGVFGIAGLVAQFVPNEGFAVGSGDRLLFGPDYISSKPDVLSRLTGNNAYFVHHYSNGSSGASYWQASRLEFEVDNSGNASQTLRDPKIEKGEPNKITDWLMWLKEAKLQDAEDILTICIIAILQWLPRIFMFIFFLLMGLGIIANVKPWVIFCDRYFDPYKFLTAGRMDVHTVDVRKVMICSMIALVLFGFFQNGLILDIIAWCARAVMGILNR